jgi:hypothetical protein
MFLQFIIQDECKKLFNIIKNIYKKSINCSQIIVIRKLTLAMQIMYQTQALIVFIQLSTSRRYPWPYETLSVR